VTLTHEPPAETAANGPAAAPPSEPAPALPEDRPRRRLWLVGAAAVVVAVALLGATGAFSPAPAPTPIPGPVRLPYDARGRVVPVLQARVAAIQGGVVRALPRVPGQPVADREELARLETLGGAVEVLSAPYAGTMLAVPVRLGDTVSPGTVVAIVGDLSQLRVETTDVDEYLIGKLRIGQPVEIAVDALPGQSLNGRVESVSLVAQAGAGTRLHYPVTVALDRPDPALRASMTARLRFG
jgi:multidrug efflux pump subunit AcrA (membrane-fusion protein)